MWKQIFVVLLCCFMLSGQVHAEQNTYDSKGRITKTTYDDGTYDTYYYGYGGSVTKETHDTQGRTLVYLYYNNATSFASNTPSSKYENVFDDSLGTQTSVYYYSAEAIENNRPDYKGIFTNDASYNEISRIEYYSAEAVENDAPDYKAEYTYNENNERISEVQYNSAEAIAGNSPDFKWAQHYDAEKGVWLDEYYYSSEAIASNTPDQRSFYIEDKGISVSYDSDGNLSGLSGDDVVIFDEHGRIEASGASVCVR